MISKDVDKVIKEAAKSIKPSKKEEKAVLKKINALLKKIRPALKKVGAKAVLGGSGAKSTWLSGTFDADIFVKFTYKKYSAKSAEISEVLNKIMKKCFKKYSRLKGSRDYFQVDDKGFIFEIVPILDISKAVQAKNITDMSLLHAKWVVSRIKKKKRLADEIRMTKSFCKSAGVYGAESYIRGFSGYVCEILTIHHGSFKKLLIASKAWFEKPVVDPMKFYRGKVIAAELNKSKIEGPLIVIDPVDKTRNAAAALSKENFVHFKDKAHEFLRNPKKEDFEKKPLNINDIKASAQDNKLIILEAAGSSGKEDVVGCRLRKVFEYIDEKLFRNDFVVLDKGWEFDRKNKALFWFILDSKDLPFMQIQIGPPIGMKDFVAEFKKKHNIIFVEKGRVHAEIKRQFTKPEDLISFLTSKDAEVTARVEKIKRVV